MHTCDTGPFDTTVTARPSGIPCLSQRTAVLKPPARAGAAAWYSGPSGTPGVCWPGGGPSIPPAAEEYGSISRGPSGQQGPEGRPPALVLVGEAAGYSGKTLIQSSFLHPASRLEELSTAPSLPLPLDTIRRPSEDWSSACGQHGRSAVVGKSHLQEVGEPRRYQHAVMRISAGDAPKRGPNPKYSPRFLFSTLLESKSNIQHLRAPACAAIAGTAQRLRGTHGCGAADVVSLVLLPSAAAPCACACMSDARRMMLCCGAARARLRSTVLTGTVKPIRSTHGYGAAHPQCSRVRCSPSAVLTGTALLWGRARSPSLRSDRWRATSSSNLQQRRRRVPAE